MFADNIEPKVGHGQCHWKECQMPEYVQIRVYGENNKRWRVSLCEHHAPGGLAQLKAERYRFAVLRGMEEVPETARCQWDACVKNANCRADIKGPHGETQAKKLCWLHKVALEESLMSRLGWEVAFTKLGGPLI